MKDRDSGKKEVDHHAKMLPSTAWLKTILQAKNTTVGMIATCSRWSPDLEPSITAEIAYTHMDRLLHRTANESTYYAPPPRKRLLGTTTKCYYRKPSDPFRRAQSCFCDWTCISQGQSRCKMCSSLGGMFVTLAQSHSTTRSSNIFIEAQYCVTPQQILPPLLLF